MQVIPLVVSLVVALVAREARACSFPAAERFEAESDGVLPPAPEVAFAVSRAQFACPGIPMNSCADLATLQLVVGLVGASRVGLVVSFGDGAPVSAPFDGPMTAFASDDGTLRLTFPWADGTEFEQEPLDFEVSVALDDGDRGPATVLRVTDPGRSGTPDCPPADDAGTTGGETDDAGTPGPLTGNDDVPTQAGCGCDASGFALPMLLGPLARRRRR